MELIRIGHAAFSVLIVHRRFKGSESIGFNEPMGCEVIVRMVGQECP